MNKTRPLFLPLIVFLLVIFVLHSAAIRLHLYWTLWWFDMVMHLLGGLWVGLAVLWWYSLRTAFDSVLVSPRRSFLVMLVFVLIIGVAWELYEYAVGVTFALNDYRFDTFSDLSLDIAGGLTAYLNYLRTHA